MSGFDWGEFTSSVNDTFKALGTAYLGAETVKAQAGAIKSQAEYNALTGYNSSYIQNPNAYPMSAQQLAAYQAQQAAGFGGLGISTPVLLLGGLVLIGAVLVLK